MKYFQHSSSSFNDEKIMKLFINCGYEGLGLFYTALEKFASSESPIEEDILKKMLFMSKRMEKTWEIIKTLGLIQSKDGEVFSENLLNYAGKYVTKKEKVNERVKKFRDRSPDNQNVTKNVTRYKDVTKKNVTLTNKEEGIRNKEKEEEYLNIIKDAKGTFVYSQCLEFWLKEFRIGWIFNGANGKALKTIILNIKKLLKDQGKEITDETILTSFKAICYRLPDWYKDKDLLVINSKFNEIIEQIKNKQNGVNEKQSAEFYRS